MSVNESKVVESADQAASRVFISHSTHDAPAALQVVAALEADGIPCWIAPRDIAAGSDWNHQIMTAINDCRAFLLIYSRHAVASDPVKREVERAVARGVKVVPVRLEKVPPSPALEFLISSYQWVNGYPPPLDRHLEALVTAVRQALDMPVDASATRPKADTVPEYVGPFRILGPLGEGGMGSVYKAEQRHPVKRTVAVKLIKPGVDTKEVIARFESERQALARMDHPNVAKVLDAGADDKGRPYFVMEYVPGVPITTFADEQKLTVRQRLELFLQVCDAIAHAHTKAIIHRDIKSSNVLAYLADGKPLVKVIDFGIAKALTGDRLTDRTLNTVRGQAVGTYDSMSPEQADGSPDIDTRSDVYSLGVLLYELLTGAKPFDSATLAKAADEEIRRMIREDEPPRPSTRVSTLANAAAVAAARHAKIDALSRELRNELEWIPLMAMRKERDRRYTTPIDLAADIRNYLSNRPLKAGPESLAYRMRKLARRNRATVATVAAFLLLIGAAIGVYIHGIRSEQKKTQAALEDARKQRDEANHQKAEADRQRDQAKKEEATADAVVALLTGMLSSADPSRMMGEHVTVLQVMHQTEIDLDNGRLKDRPQVEAAVRGAIANTLRGLAYYDSAEKNAVRALACARAAYPGNHEKIAEALHILANVYQEEGRYPEAEPLFRDALAIARQSTPPDEVGLATALNNLAAILNFQGQFDQAVPLMREALELSKKQLRPDPATVVLYLNNLGALLRDTGDEGGAESHFRQALQMARASLEPTNPNTAMVLGNIAKLLAQHGDFQQAEPMLREVLDIQRRTFAPDHPQAIMAIENLAQLLTAEEKFAEAESLHREVVDIRRKVTSRPLNLAQALGKLGVALGRAHKLTEAHTTFLEALDLLRRNLPPDDPQIAMCLTDIGSVLNEQKKFDQAKTLFTQALEIRRKAFPPGHPMIAYSLMDLGGACEDLEDFPQAERHYREALDIRRSDRSAPPENLASSAGAVGWILKQQKRFDEAEPFLREALSIYQSARGKHARPTTQAAGDLADLLEATHRKPQAAALRKEYQPPATQPTTRATTLPTANR